jgi:Cu/Ag efflux pump CusA
MRWIIGSSLRYRRLVLAAAVVLLVAGISQLRTADVEGLPDFGPTRVEVQAEALGLSAEEVENLITNPMEQEFFNGMPWLAAIRSDSLPGLSRMELVFEPGTDPIKARQVVQERLTMVRALPAVSKSPAVIQPTSTTSRLMMIGLSSSEVSLIEMSVLARFNIRQRLIAVPGVANVAVWGLRDRQLQVLVDPVRLRKHKVPLDAVVTSAGNAMWSSPLTFVEASTPGTGGFIDNANQRIEIQHKQPVRTAADLAQVAVDGAEQEGLRLGDVATVVEDHQLLIGDGLANDEQSLLMVVERFPGTSVSQLTRDVEEALAQLAPGLRGITVDTSLYRPASYLDTVRDNLGRSLVIGLVLLGLVLGALLAGWWRAALVGLVSFTLSLAVAALVLTWSGVRLDAMVVAGLVAAFAVLADDAAAGALLSGRRPAAEDRPDGRLAAAVAAWVQLRGDLAVATVAAVLAVVPVLALGDVTGALLRPLALGYVVAILASTAVALTVTPALSLLLPAGRSPSGESPLARALGHAQAAALGRLVGRPAGIAAAAGLLVLAGLAVLPALRHQPIAPPLQDRDVLISWKGAPGTSLPEMTRLTGRAGRELRAIPGVRSVGAHVGRASLSDRIVGSDSAELWVGIDAEADYGATTDAIAAVAEGYPGLHAEVTTYPEQRLNAARSGSDSALVVRVYGRDYAVLQAKAAEVAGLVAGVDGVAQPRVSVPEYEPTVEVEVDIVKAAAVGLKPGDARRAAATMASGITAGHMYEGQKIYAVTVWGTPATRHSLSSIQDLLIDSPKGGHVRLGDVATVRVRPNPTNIRHDAVARYLDVTADVRGRSLGDVTRDVENAVRAVTFPTEHHLEVLSDPAQRQETRQRTVAYAVAFAIALFFLLQATFGSWRLATLLFGLLPAALAGGLLVAALRDDVMSLAALMGLAAVLAIAVRSGVVQIRLYQRLERDGGEPGRELVLRGTRERSGPVLVGALATAAVLAPFAVLGVAPGFEIVQPLVAVVLGGLVTTTLLTLFVLPALYLRFAGRPGPAPADPHDDDREPADATR